MKKTRAEGEELWAEEISRWKGSGQSAATYCLERNLKYTEFGYWKRRLGPVKTGKEIQKANGFVPIPVIPNPVGPELFFRVGGFEVLIRNVS